MKTLTILMILKRRNTLVLSWSQQLKIHLTHTELDRTFLITI